MMQKDKLCTIRKQKDYTQQQIADAIATEEIEDNGWEILNYRVY
ncbi:MULTISPECIES: hypothetical protein [Chryseobacterium]|nr:MULTISPECIES: hypothetical protein [Chryseobacterium]